MKKIKIFLAGLTAREKKFVKVIIALTIATTVATLWRGQSETRIVKQYEEKLVEHQLQVVANAATINVSEADASDTRIKAYANNISISLDGENISIKEGAPLGTNQYVSNGVVVTFTEKNGEVVATAQYGQNHAGASFKIAVAALINDANGNTTYDSPSYGFQFDAAGNKTNNGHIETHEQDLDTDGNVVGIQNETQVKMTETQIVDSKPVNKPAGSKEPAKTAESAEVKKDYEKEVVKKTEGADMSNVEPTVEKVATDVVADYRQISIANSNANDDGTTLNYVATNGGTKTLVVVCLSVEGNVYHCVTRQGESLDLILVNSNGNITFTGINGTYR